MNNPGPEPASEPETQHVIRLLEELQPDYANSIHCCGNMWLTPYGLEGKDPVDQELYEAICDEAFGYDPEVREQCGPIWDVIYPVSGDMADTAYEHTGALTFGYEMSGRGAVALWGQPVVHEDVREQEHEAWGGLMHAFLEVHRYGAHPVVTAIHGDQGTLTLEVTNDGLGTLVRGQVALQGRSVDLPELAPGQSTQVPVDGPFRPGPTELVLDWQKRLMKAPDGTRTLAIDLVEGPAGLAGHGPGLAAASQDPAPQGPQAVPASPVVAGLLVLAAVALARTRHR